MNITRALPGLGLLIMSLSCKRHAEPPVTIAYSGNHLIEVHDLASIIDHDSVVVIDMRKPEDYSAQHIPGAVNIWRADIQNDSLPYSGMIASQAHMENLLGRLGIENDQFLVIYDDKASCDAARLWWVLDYYGYEKTALLHGGIKAWQNIGKLTASSTPRPSASFRFPANHSPTRFVNLKALERSFADSSMVLIDSRTLEEYNGYYKKTGAYDSGRIPGSINIDWAENVHFDQQAFKTIEEIQDNYSMIDSTSNIVVYCHSGVRSAHTTFVLTQLLGYKNVKNYDGSWTEWSYHELPAQRDSL